MEVLCLHSESQYTQTFARYITTRRRSPPFILSFKNSERTEYKKWMYVILKMLIIALSSVKIENPYTIPSKTDLVFQTYERNKLAKAIKSQTTVQQPRLIMHFEKGMSYKEIGEIEGCKHQAI